MRGIDRNTMVELRLIEVSLFLILMLQFKAATGQDILVFTVKDGHDAILPCKNVIYYQNKCASTTWIFSGSRNPSAVALFEHRKIKTESNSKSDRLSVTENCSLFIKKVTVEDVGRYSCKQFDKSGQQQGSDSVVDVSVVTISPSSLLTVEYDRNNDVIRAYCSVLTYGECEHTVEWLYEGQKDDVETSRFSCSATVTFTASHLNTKNNFQLLKCKVTHIHSKKVQEFALSPQSSGEETGFWCVYIIVAVVLTTLLVSVFVIMRLKKTKGSARRMNVNTGLSINPAETQCGPETNDTTDPEDEVCYIDISFTKKTNRKVQGDDDEDEGEAGTYSTVKASSSSAAAASTDPSSLYAAIN